MVCMFCDMALPKGTLETGQQNAAPSLRDGHSLGLPIKNRQSRTARKGHCPQRESATHSESFTGRTFRGTRNGT